MESYYFRQIRLPFHCKVELIHLLMRFIASQTGAVPREEAFFKRFVAESTASLCLKELPAARPWLAEHVARLFWVCCELGLLKYQYPYPHKGQTYLPTRAGRIMAIAPRIFVTAFVGTAYIAAIIVGPVRYFNRVRNIVTVFTGLLLWWRHFELTPYIILVSISAGIISTWIASFFSSLGD